MSLSFEIARVIHIPELIEMMEDFYAIDGYPFHKSEAAKNLEQFIASATLGRIWLIKEYGSISGYLIATFGFSFEYGGRDAFIDELYLKADSRGRGIGDQALQYLENMAPELGIRAIHLEVEKTNSNASKLYLKRGYQSNDRLLLTKKIGTIPGTQD